MKQSEAHLPNWLARCAEQSPQQLAIRYGEMSWTFAELDDQVTHLARQFATLGIQEQSRVALLAANGLASVVTVHALICLKAILIPLNTRLTVEELCWQIRDIRASHLISDIVSAKSTAHIVQAIPELLTGVLQLEPRTQHVFLQDCAEDVHCPLHTVIDLDAIQSILYTSGTTGKAKGVLITYGMQWWNAIGSLLTVGYQRDDCWLVCLPLYHIGGLAILFRSVIYGMSILLQEKFDAAAINQAICEQGVTIISVVAVMLQRLLAASNGHGYPASLRCVLLGGGPVARPLLEHCLERAIPVVQTYGLTEACSQAVTLPPADALRKLGSAGRPLPQIQLRIVHDDQPARVGEAGTIYLKGPSITPGYADRPEATAETIRDGWLCTGDIGYVDQDGYLFVLDRRSDLIISGGENVYPAEIESVLLSHPDVAEAGVCGRMDAQWGQVPMAFVCLHAGHEVTPEALLLYAQQRLARYKVPRTISIVDQLPRNASGKLLRRALGQG